MRLALWLSVVGVGWCLSPVHEDDYLWGFSQVGGVAGPAFRQPVPAHWKQWFKHLVNAEAHTQRGRLDDAVDSYTSILKNFRLPDKELQEVHLALGQVLTNMSLLDRAETSFRHAASVRADTPLPHYCLGVVHTKQGRFDDALKAYETALFFDPSFFPAVHNIGSVYTILGNMDQALYYHQAALDRLRETQQAAITEAEKHVALPDILYRYISHVQRCFSEVRGGGKESYADVAAALHLFTKHISMLDMSTLHLELALALQNRGAFDISRLHFQRSLALNPKQAWIELHLMLSLPTVFDSLQGVHFYTNRVKQYVEEAVEDGFTIARPHDMKELYSTTYMLPFTGLPTRAVLTSIAKLWSQGLPRLAVVARGLDDRYRMSAKPHLRLPPAMPPTTPKTIIRVGILSYQLYDSPVGRLLRCLVDRLVGFAPSKVVRPGPSFGGGAGKGSPQVPGVKGFHVTVVLPRPYGDHVTKLAIDGADSVVRLPFNPRDPELAVKHIAGAKLDVLICMDHALDAYMYSLMQARMAPVQMVFWSNGGGHSATLGFKDTVDYYVTGDGTAADTMQDEFEEQVVRLGDLGMLMAPIPPVSEEEKFALVSRMSLFDARHLFLVPAPLIFLHPEFDEVIGRILSADASGEVLVLFEPKQELWLERVRKRLRAGEFTKECYQRVRFTAQLEQRDLWALISSADVVLDPFPVGLGTTALETLTLGIPVVTLPAKQGPRRVAAAALRRLDVSELVAGSIDEYVNMALTLARQPVERFKVALKLGSRREALVWHDGLGESPGDFNRSAAQMEDLHRLQVEITGNGTLRDDILAYVQRQEAMGYGDPQAAALNDWVALIARAGHPWAKERTLVAAKREKSVGKAPAGKPKERRTGRRNS